MSDYIEDFFRDAQVVAAKLPTARITQMVDLLAEVHRNGGRVFFLGVGGGAAHASHAVNDFRKIAEIECYTPSDNVAELTARINDDGWDTSYANWLRVSRLGARDAVFVISVGGGNLERNVSANLVRSLDLAQSVGARILGVVGRDGGHTARVADACIVIPVPSSEMTTPMVESFQSLILHAICSHPRLKVHAMKWESTVAAV